MSYSNSFPTQTPTLNLNFATGSNQLDSRLSYSRSSSATAFSSEKHLSSENLLPYSNDLSQSAWTKSGATTPSANNAAPDGTSTATALIENSSASMHAVFDYFPSTSGSSYSFTAYAKANGRTKFQIVAAATSAIATVTFDLTAATSTVSAGSADSHSITAIGSSGWFKCVVTVTATGTGTNAYYQINLLDAGGAVSYTGDGSSGLFLWGMQVSSTGETVLNATSGSIHRQFAPTLKTSAANEPRFEYSATGGQPEGLLIEQQFTQYSHYSEEFDNGGGWAKTNATIQQNSGIAPDGTLSADLLVEAYETSGTNSHYMRQNTLSSVAVGETYTWTIFAKAAGRSAFAIYSSIGGANVMCYWNLVNGSVSQTSGTGSFSSTDCGNGWYRLEMTFTTTSTAAGSNYFYIVSNGATGYQGNGYGSVLLWGANLTKTASSMSYLKAEATTVTKAVDSCTVDMSSFYTGGEVSGIVEAKNIGKPYPTFATLTDSTANQRILLQGNDAGTYVTSSIVTDGAVVANPNSALILSSSKVGFRCDTDNFGTVVNGGTVATDTSGAIPATMTTLHIGQKQDGNFQVNGNIGRLSLYSAALSDTELKSLTSS